jgi:hypothetical protein
MFLCASAKEINRRKVDWTFHGSKFVVDVLWLRPHNDSSPVLSKTLNAAQVQNAPVAMPHSVIENRLRTTRTSRPSPSKIMTHVSGDEASLPVVGSFGTLDPLPTRFKGDEGSDPLPALFDEGDEGEGPPDPSPGVVGEVEGDDGEGPPDPSPGVVVDVVDEVEVVGAVSLSGCDAVPLGPSPTVFVATTEIV